MRTTETLNCGCIIEDFGIKKQLMVQCEKHKKENQESVEKKEDLLETVDFVDVMQCYRIATPADQSKVIRRFEEVKDWIRKHFIQKPEITPFEKAIQDTIEGSKKIDETPVVKIDWQIEEWTERAESIAKIIGYDEAGNKYEGSAIIIGGLLDGSIERIEEFEMVAKAATRPDLSFITKQSFKSDKEYIEWKNSLDLEQYSIVHTFQTKKIVELIQCAEMLFDANQDKPEGFVFKIVSETLNVK